MPTRRRRARPKAQGASTPDAVPGRAAGVRAKLFANGRSQAVRLPKEFRMQGAEVLVRRHGSLLVLEPLAPSGLPAGFWARIDGLMHGLDFPDPEPIGAKLLDLPADL